MRCDFEITYEKPNKQGPGLMQCPRRAAGTTAYGTNVCIECITKYQLILDTHFAAEIVDILTFAQFSETNRKRCESPSPNGFGESLNEGSEYDPEYFAMAAGEEVGEVIGAVLGANGKKKRKKHFTKQNVFDEIGDAVACLDLLAQRYGGTLAECVVKKFNEVSDRLGSDIKL